MFTAQMQSHLTRISTLVCFVALLTACGGGGTSSGGGGGKPASFRIPQGGPPICDNPDFTAAWEGGSLFYNCSWFCASYKGRERVSVEIDFEQKPNEPWKVSSESISDGVCPSVTWEIF